MATITSASLSSPAERRGGLGNPLGNPLGKPLAEWRQFLARAFDTYRPELHYMRGPGPACRAKQAASSQRHSS
jgi:hypothetical protein